MEVADMVADRDEEENGIANHELRILVVRERETHPDDDDDCCPICYESFNIPCKTNCGHWFCAGCILMFWNYSTALQRCKCPICCRLISKLIPEASLTLQQEEEVVETLKKVQRYNRLFVGGALGLIMKVHQLPLFFRRFFAGMLDPNRHVLNYCAARIIALLLTVLYKICGFDFIPAGTLVIKMVFDYCAVALVIILYLVGMYRRHRLGRHARLLATTTPLP